MWKTAERSSLPANRMAEVAVLRMLAAEARENAWPEPCMPARERPVPTSHGVRSRGQSQGLARHRTRVRRMHKARRQTLPDPLATAGQIQGMGGHGATLRGVCKAKPESAIPIQYVWSTIG